jgi:hypothetical protein
MMKEGETTRVKLGDGGLNPDASNQRGDNYGAKGNPHKAEMTQMK